MGYWGYYYPPRLTVAERRAKAAREMKKLEKKGRTVSPVVIEGRDIATTFWGKAWCDNVESYSDLENRLPRGRSYAKSGAVCDLQIGAGVVTALVCGTEMYEVRITTAALPKVAWARIKAQCAGKIGSLIELLRGELSKAVMEVVTRRDGGLFPLRREIKMTCSCPDFAGLCKHRAAVLYGIGHRLDQQPELLFKLRQVDHSELIGEAGAATAAVAGRRAPGRSRTLAAADLAGVFGVDLEPDKSPEAPTPAAPKAKSRAKHGREPGHSPRPRAGRRAPRPARRGA